MWRGGRAARPLVSCRQVGGTQKEEEPNVVLTFFVFTLKTFFPLCGLSHFYFVTYSLPTQLEFSSIKKIGKK